MTSAAGVFAGGELRLRTALIIDSVADGKRAAVGIDEFLRGKNTLPRLWKWRCFERHRMPLNLLDLVRPTDSDAAAQSPHRSH